MSVLCALIGLHFVTHLTPVYPLQLSLELDVRVGVPVIAVSKTQMNRPDEANIKTSILYHCLNSDASWDSTLARKV